MSTAVPTRQASDARLTPIVALVVVALVLRPQLSAIGPLADPIIESLGVSHAYVGLLTTIPVLCMGVFALAGPPMAHALGIRSGITASVAILVLFAILRTVVPGAVPLLLLTFGVGVGTGTIGPILPMFVRGRVPGRVVAGTAAYAGGTIVGAAVGSALAVPLEALTGSWQASLLVLSLASLLAVGGWAVLVRSLPGRDPATPKPERPQLPLRRPIAWAIGILFGLQSWLYYGTTAWLANVYVERGWDPAAAAGLLTLVNVASLAAIVLVPWLSGRGTTRRTLLVAASVAASVGLAGITLLADGAILWAVLVGAGLGMTFTLVLTLPVDISHDPREAGGAAALMLVMGYLIASAAPFVLGAVRDATGNFEVSLLLLVAIALVMIPFGWSLTPRRLRPPRRVPVP